jgi:hypothetical protein
MSLSDLTKGAVRNLLSEDNSANTVDPICQVLTIKRIPPNAEGAPERFRVIISDGVDYTQGKC